MNAQITRLCGAPLLVLLTGGLEPGGSFAALPHETLLRDELGARAGDLRMILRQDTTGIQLLSLYDSACGEELLGTNQTPLFSLTLRQAGSKKEVRLVADDGWRRTTLRQTRDGIEARWLESSDESLSSIAVIATASADRRNHAWHWKLRVENPSADWSVWRVVFPQLALAAPGTNSAVLFPRGPGEVQKNVSHRAFKFSGKYPDGWCSMQFMAAYRDREKPSGLYVGVHDPWGSTKEIVLESDTNTCNAQIRFDHPAPDMGRPGNDFELRGVAVWQLLRGDWFDAAQIYKAWARKNARWWPRLTAEGRADTPPWMRELNAWAMTGGAPEQCVTNVQNFQKFIGEPVGFHWYNWHQVPFDNDYPHYFPAKTNLTGGVAELERSHVFVMPYINGRLWDTHDQGANDWKFTRLALPAASKKEDGQAYVETYGSKETNGEPVRLAVMCPTTVLWQQTVSNIVSRLLGEVGTSAVYIDHRRSLSA